MNRSRNDKYYFEKMSNIRSILNQNEVMIQNHNLIDSINFQKIETYFSNKNQVISSCGKLLSRL